jgi:hypothetical protein
MHALAIGLAMVVLVFVLSRRHFLFLPFFVPFALLGFGQRRRQVNRRGGWVIR